jgi:maltose/moltooligosaccharide transporter
MSAAQRLAFLGCSFSLGVFNAFNNFTLSLWLLTLTSSYLVIGLLGNSRSFEGAIVSPLAGAWSDRTWAGWLGRRRPFILFGGVASAFLLALTPAASRVSLPFGLPPDVARIAPAVLAIFLFTLTFNLMDDIHKALLADIARGDERNRLSAFSVVVDMGGQVAILVLGFLLWQEAVPDSAFAVAGGLLFVGVLVTVLGIREPPPAVWKLAQAEEAPPKTTASGSIWSMLAAYRPAVVFCIVFFAYWSGVSAVLPLISVYTRDVLGASVGEAQLLPALLLLSTTLLAIPMGALGTRLGKRRVLAAGYSVMALAALAGLLVTTKEQGAIIFLLAGVGNAASMVLTIPLLADLVPPTDMGKAAGALAASGSIAAPLASVIGGGLSDIYGPRAIFAVMAAMTVLALALLPGTRTARSVS